MCVRPPPPQVGPGVRQGDGLSEAHCTDRHEGVQVLEGQGPSHVLRIVFPLAAKCIMMREECALAQLGLFLPASS